MSVNREIRFISIVFGFLLLVGLAQVGIFSSGFVAVLIVFVNCYEIIRLRAFKKIKEVHWGAASTILLLSAYAYICSSTFWIKGFLFLVMFICCYGNLYKLCYYEQMTMIYLKKMICDSPILLLLNTTHIFDRMTSVQDRDKHHKIIAGTCLLLPVLLCGILPLYSAADPNVREFIFALGNSIMETVPILVICFLLGIIPAMVNYSVLIGLVSDVVLRNPERNVKTPSVQDDLLYNKIVFQIILWGLTAVNFVFFLFQIVYLFDIDMYKMRIEATIDMAGILPLLIASGMNMVFMVVSTNWSLHQARADNIKFVMNMYCISNAGILILILFRYGVKIAEYGISNSTLAGLFTILLFSLILCIGTKSSILYKHDTLYKCIICGTVLYVALTVLPLKYIVAQTNVAVFMNRCTNELSGTVISEQDFNLEYLIQMGPIAVPALVELMDVEEIYEPSQMKLGQTVRNEVIKMLSWDLTAEEVEFVQQQELDKQVETLLRILQDKTAYVMPGPKKEAYKAFVNYELSN